MLKKLLVLLISLFMMIPHSFVTFAENAEESDPAEIIEKEPLTVQPTADEEKDIRDISVGETVTVNIENGGDKIYYRFVPETSDKYVFESMSDGFDTYGYLYDENFNELTSDDDGNGSCNFRITYQLEAGVTYYFAAEMDISDQTGSFEAKLSVYEPTAAEELYFNRDSYGMRPNYSMYITNLLHVQPYVALGDSVLTSSDETVVEVSGNYVNAKAAGEATLTATSANGITASTLIKVGNYADYISQTSDYNQYLDVGQSVQLTYKLEPEGADFSDETVVWKITEGEEHISLDEEGNVTALSAGNAVVLLEISNGSSTAWYISVSEPLTSLSFKNETNYLPITAGGNYIWNYLNYEPNEAYGYPLSITSSDESIVRIDGNSVYGVSKGTATITVTAKNGVSASAEFIAGDYASRISSSQSFYNMTPGEEIQLAYQLYPENTEFADEVVTWSITDDPNGAITVDQTGRVTAVKVGSAALKATITNGSYVTYHVTVNPKSRKISFTDMNYYLAVGSSKYIDDMMVFNPVNSKNAGAEYSSSNEDIMSVSGRSIQGNALGTAILTATTDEGCVAKTKIHVGKYATGIWPKGETSRTLKVGDSVQLEYDLYGNGDYSEDEFKWRIDYAENNCISLSETGEVTALAGGIATIRVSGKAGATTFFYITVADQPVSISFEQSEYTVVAGESFEIYADVTPESGAYTHLKWESSDTSIAEIGFSNYNHTPIYGRKEGTATIKAYSAEDESIYAECTVKVVPQVPATSFTIAPTATAYVGYRTGLKYTTEPFNGDPNVTVSADNDNVSFSNTASGYVSITGVKKGTTVLTLTSTDGKVTASTTITVKEEYTETKGNWYIGHRNPTNGLFYNYQKNPAEYLFVKGESYHAGTEIAYDQDYHPVDRVDIAQSLADTGLFEETHNSGIGFDMEYSYNGAYGTASKAGTAEVELINGKKVKVTVIDAAWLGAKISADSSIPAEIADAFKEYDFNLQYDTTFDAAEIDGLDSLSVNADQKAVVQSWLDVSLDEYEKDALGNIRFVFTATPKVKVVSMAKTADSASEGTDLISERTLNPETGIDVVIPTDHIFGNANVRNLKVTQKVNGADFNYVTDDFLYDDEMIVIRSENGAGQFTIIGSVSSYKDPVYTWTETADGYEVTATAESDEGEPTITETVKAVYSVEKEPECMTEGVGVYTATFTNAVFETQTKKVAIPAIGHHEYGEPEYTWSRDNKTVTAKAVCTVCGDEVTETVNTTYEVLEEPTLEEPGKGKYTAVFTNELFETQTKEVEIPSLSDKSAKDIILDKNELTILFNTSEKLNATVLPEDCEDKTVKWSSSDSSIVTVDANGNVKGVKPGKATVTAETVNGLTDTCEVRVLFTDVAVSSQYFFTPVYWAVDNGITVGAGGPGKFSPTASCTREQFVTFLWRLNGQPEPKSSSDFSDVKNSDWYYKPITWAAENGITVGLNDGTGRFGVGQACTREQCVTFLHRSVGSPEPAGSMEFTDSQAGRYYYKAIKWAAGKGITVGLNDGTGRFGVGQKCTRGMLVTFLYRFDQTK